MPVSKLKGSQLLASFAQSGTETDAATNDVEVMLRALGGGATLTIVQRDEAVSALESAERHLAEAQAALGRAGEALRGFSLRLNALLRLAPESVFEVSPLVNKASLAVEEFAQRLATTEERYESAKALVARLTKAAESGEVAS